MKNKYYNIFFTSEKDGLGKSFRVSTISLLSTFFLFLCIMFFAYTGLNRIIGRDSITYQLDQLQQYKYVTSNLLIESGMRREIINSEDLEKIIIDYIIENNLAYPSTPPVNGYVTKGILKNDKEITHAGISIASKIKDDVKAPLEGVVVVAENDDVSGSIIIMHHQNNFFTIYKNLDTLFVSPRDLIAKDEVIARVGNATNEGSHLHFEIWKDNQVIDPRNLITHYKEKDVSIR